MNDIHMQKNAMFCRQCQSVLTVRLSGGDATAAAISVRVEKE